MTNEELTQAAETFVKALNARAEERIADGCEPLYKRFGFEVGRTHARVFTIDSAGHRSATAFVSADGYVRHSDSWKKPGRVIGAHGCSKVLDLVSGPVLTGR